MAWLPRTTPAAARRSASARRPGVVESHPVDQRLAARPAGTAAGDRSGCGWAVTVPSSDVAEAERRPGIESPFRFVHPGGQAHQCRKPDAGNLNRRAMPGASAATGNQAGLHLTTLLIAARVAIVNPLRISAVRAKQDRAECPPVCQSTTLVRVAPTARTHRPTAIPAVLQHKSGPTPAGSKEGMPRSAMSTSARFATDSPGLKGPDSDIARPDRLDALYGGRQALHSRHARNVPAARPRTNLITVETRPPIGAQPVRGIEDQVHLAIQDGLHDGLLAVGPRPLAVLADRSHL